MAESGFVGVTLRVRDERGEWAGSAALSYVDDAELSMAATFQQAVQRLVTEVFGDGQATG